MTYTLQVADALDAMKQLPDCHVDTIITSPPYNKSGIAGKKTKIGNQIWDKFRIDYGSYHDNMPEAEYQDWMVLLLDEMHRIIKPNGSIFFNHKPRRFDNRCFLPTDFIGRSKAKLYQLIIWNRKNSPNIRNDILVPCTEHIYWLCKDKPKVCRDKINPNYCGEVWNISPGKQKDHPAPFPEQLVENCVLLSTVENDLVLDPFVGSGTTGVVSVRLNRNFLGIDIDQNYVTIAEQRIESSKQEFIG